jgi:hypothetical protein
MCTYIFKVTKFDWSYNLAFKFDWSDNFTPNLIGQIISTPNLIGQIFHQEIRFVAIKTLPPPIATKMLLGSHDQVQ